MARHAAKTRSSGDPEVMMEINTTPLIDVMLVLLVMLIVTIPIQLHSVNLEMPVGAAASNARPEKVQIDIDGKNVVYWQGLPVDAGVLEQKMAAMARLPVPPELHIRPDKDAHYAVFANVLASSKRLGLNKIAVIGAEQFVK